MNTTMFYSLLQREREERVKMMETARTGGTVMTRVGVRVTVQVQFIVGESATIYVLH